ncbi:MAG: sigma-54 dependent transcriptional regulator [Deltaproteobacteria bacterium]|nr:sigma-54 dependent transcriptional regulator [Deltaproteobacteria bacterium]
MIQSKAKEKCLLIEDDHEFASFIASVLDPFFELVHVDSLESAFSEVQRQSFDLFVCDYQLGHETCEPLISFIRGNETTQFIPFLVLSALAEVPIVVKLFELGIDDFVSKGSTVDEIRARILSAKRVRDLYYRANKALQENKNLKNLAGVDKIIGDSSHFISQLQLAEKVATSDVPILILGETGVGKDVFARFIHEKSQRQASLVSINVSAIPKDLIESELFGYEKGAFSGASGRKTGLFELANKGTLFLDEIGDMPLELQPKLLRVLQDRKIRRLGGTSEVSVDFRLICATSVDLEEKISRGEFRQDLFYRINLITLKIPPLRERKSDIPKLAEYFLACAENRFNFGKKTFSQRCLDWLLNQRWRGNVRELENTVYRLYLTSDSDVIDIDGDPVLQSEEEIVDEHKSVYVSTGTLNLETRIELVEKALFKEALQIARGNKSKAAQLIGISRVTFLQKLKKYNISDFF